MVLRLKIVPRFYRASPSRRQRDVGRHRARLDYRSYPVPLTEHANIRFEGQSPKRAKPVPEATSILCPTLWCRIHANSVETEALLRFRTERQCYERSSSLYNPDQAQASIH